MPKGFKVQDVISEIHGEIDATAFDKSFVSDSGKSLIIPDNEDIYYWLNLEREDPETSSKVIDTITGIKDKTRETAESMALFITDFTDNDGESEPEERLCIISGIPFYKAPVFLATRSALSMCQ